MAERDIFLDADNSGSSRNRPRGRRGEITTRPSRGSSVRPNSPMAGKQDLERERMDTARRQIARERDAALARSQASGNSIDLRDEIFDRSENDYGYRSTRSNMPRENRTRRPSVWVEDNLSSTASSRYAKQSYDRRKQPANSDQLRQYSQSSREYHDRERALRDVKNGGLRKGNREVIDARGSVDSRAFNERQVLYGYSINEEDKPDPMVDTSNPKAKWKSHAGQGFMRTGQPRGITSRLRQTNLSSLSDTISGKDSFSQSSGIFQPFAGVSRFVLIMIALIIVLAIVLLVILFS